MSGRCLLHLSELCTLEIGTPERWMRSYFWVECWAQLVEHWAYGWGWGRWREGSRRGNTYGLLWFAYGLHFQCSLLIIYTDLKYKLLLLLIRSHPTSESVEQELEVGEDGVKQFVLIAGQANLHRPILDYLHYYGIFVDEGGGCEGPNHHPVAHLR